MNEMDRAYDLMKEYDSLPHHYGDYVLYQAESHMIEHIGMNEGVTITKLAEELGKTRSACCQMVRKLRNKKWVEQIRNERNNREYNLYLTGKESVFLRIMRNLIFGAIRGILRGLRNSDMKIWKNTWRFRKRLINHFRRM